MKWQSKSKSSPNSTNSPYRTPIFVLFPNPEKADRVKNVILSKRTGSKGKPGTDVVWCAPNESNEMQ